jgi:hypothetical protein
MHALVTIPNADGKNELPESLDGAHSRETPQTLSISPFI